MALPPPPRTAIVTAWDGHANSRYACAVSPWCFFANGLRRAIPGVEDVIVLTVVKILINNATKNAEARSPNCVDVKFWWPSETVAAARAYWSRLRGPGAAIRVSGRLKSAADLAAAAADEPLPPVLLKMAALSLPFDLVLFADLDVKLHWRPADASAYQRAARAFMSSPFAFSTVPDHSSPSNGGVFAVKPSASLGRDVLRLLRRARFTRCCGFRIGNHSATGPPRASYAPELLSALARGRGYRGRSHVAAMADASAILNATEAFRTNTWSFVFSELDQGIFWHLFYATSRRGTWASSERKAWRVPHYWGPFKPWQWHSIDRNTAAMVHYQHGLRGDAYSDRGLDESAHAPGREGGSTPCAQQLDRQRAALQAKGAWNPNGGWSRNVRFFSVLPSEDVASGSMLRQHQ
jgi:hypothetical protein